MVQAKAKSSGTNNMALVRQVVLVLLLIVAIGAAVYDFKMARPAAQRAYDTIQKMSEESSDESLTNEAIQQVLKKKPSVTLGGPESNTYLEKYTWVSGLLFKSYYVWVVYTPNEPHVFQAHFLNSDVEDSLRHDYKIPGQPSLPPPGQPGGVGGAGKQGASGAPPGGPPSGAPAGGPPGGPPSGAPPGGPPGGPPSGAPPGGPPPDTTTGQSTKTP